MVGSSSGVGFSSRHWFVTVVAAFVLAATLTPTAVATVQAGSQDAEIGLDAPNEATVGLPATVSATVSVPNSTDSHETQLALALYVDGKKTEEKALSMEVGDTKNVTFKHTFESAGNHTVAVRGGPINSPKWETNASAVISVKAGPDPISASGPAFQMPDSLDGEVERYRPKVPTDRNQHQFVLAADDRLYVVFTDKQPRKGLASVSGIPVGQQFHSDGLTYGVLVARSTSFETRGPKTSIGAVVSDPDRYRHELVRIRATHRQVTVRSDPDRGVHVTAPGSFGALVEDPATENGVFDRIAARAGSLSINSSTGNLGSNTPREIDSLLGADPRLYTFDFETGFWTSAEATVDGIVLTNNSTARGFVSAYDKGGIVETGVSQPLLYVVQEEFDDEEYGDVSDVSRSARAGDLVAVEAKFIGRTVSVQETLEETTACGPSRMEVQRSRDTVCVDVGHDNLVRFGVAWSGVQPERTGILFVTGVSADHMDDRSRPLRGRYHITGEIVPTSRIDPALPDGTVLVAYEMERTGSFDYGNLTWNVKTTIRDRFEQLNETMHEQIRGAGSTSTTSTGGADPTTTNQPPSTSDPDPTTTHKPTPTDAPEATTSNQPDATATTSSNSTSTTSAPTRGEATANTPEDDGWPGTSVVQYDQDGGADRQGLPGFGMAIGVVSVAATVALLARKRS